MLYLVDRRFPGFEHWTIKIGQVRLSNGLRIVAKLNTQSMVYYGYQAYYLTPILDI